MFNNMDTDKSGTITLEELKIGLNRLGSRLSETEIKQLMDAVSIVMLSCSPFISLLICWGGGGTLWFLTKLFNSFTSSRNKLKYLHHFPLACLMREFNLYIFFCQADVDQNGTIDYSEFITATMHRHKLETEEHLHKAFKYFDQDDSGLVCWFFLFFFILAEYKQGDSTSKTKLHIREWLPSGHMTIG